jgi:hypothetical protein
MKQYEDITFCQRYKGCCGTCLARNEEKEICLGNCDYAETKTQNDFSCDAYVPCELANKLIEEDNEKMQEKIMKYFEN